MNMIKPSIYGLTFDQLTAWLLERGHKKSRATQVWEWLYRKRVTNRSNMTDVNKDCLELLAEHFAFETMSEHTKQESADGTIKFLFQLQDGNLIETVLMRHKFGLSVCVTTQVGCNIGCSFCASGLLAKSRDLSSGRDRRTDHEGAASSGSTLARRAVSHIVVMGIGEPFDNFENMVDFI